MGQGRGRRKKRRKKRGRLSRLQGPALQEVS